MKGYARHSVEFTKFACEYPDPNYPEIAIDGSCHCEYTLSDR